MGVNPTIISYRSKSDQTSRFLNLDSLLKSDDIKKIEKIYIDIYRNVTAYETGHVNSLIAAEEKLFGRIVQLKMRKIEEINNKGRGWKAVALSIITFGIRPLINHVKKTDLRGHIDVLKSRHMNFSRALSQMKQRSQEKELDPKQKKIVDLERERLEEPRDELFRLYSIPRVKSSLEKLERQRKLSINQKVAIGRSLELREQIKDTHYVINHGQNLDLMLVNIVARKLKREFEPKVYETFEPLRHDTALRHIKEDTHTVAWYQNQINRGNYNDHGLRRELICGDCVLESTRTCESAIDFFSGRRNIAKYDNPSLLNNLLLTIIRDYIPDEEVAGKLCKQLVELFYRSPPGGNLYSICIPKEKFDESCYFSLPYGKPVKYQESFKTVLDNMQSGKAPIGYPQIRVLSHKIRAEDQFYVINNSTLSKEQLSKIDDEVALCIQAALTGYRIQKSSERVF